MSEMTNTDQKLVARELDDASKADENLACAKSLASLLKACEKSLGNKPPEEKLYLMGCAFMVAQFKAREDGVADEKAMQIAARSQRDGKRFRFGAPKNMNPLVENEELKQRVAELEAKLAAKG